MSESRSLKKVWITKYALTQGIFAVEAELLSDFPKMISVDANPAKRTCATTYHKPYWHMTEDEACVHAEKLRRAKIASLRKQIDALEKVRFKKVSGCGK